LKVERREVGDRPQRRVFSVAELLVETLVLVSHHFTASCAP
jgi:hypothetical protein